MRHDDHFSTPTPRHIGRRSFVQGTAAALAMGGMAGVWASEPVNTLKILVGFAPGGTADAIGRRVGERLGRGYAKSAFVENRTGAGGQIAVQATKGLPADGSGILVTPASMLMIYPHIYKKLPYDPLVDVTPLSLACTFDFGWAVGPAVPASVTNITQFVQWLKANPDKGNFGSPASGSVPHFIGELFARASATDMRHVAYRGSQPAVLDLIGGQITAVSAPIGEFLQHVGTGKVRILATSGEKRNRFAPDVPTFAEQGLGQLTASEWFGIFGPPKMPAEVVARLGGALHDALGTREVVDGLAAMGMEAASSSPQELAARLQRDHTRWAQVVKQIGFTAD